MNAKYDFDVTVIGAGIAGMVAAVTAKGLGQRVAVVEKRRVGGNCTNYTCIPSKALIRLGHVCKDISWLVDQGIVAKPLDAFDASQVMARIRSVVSAAYEKDRPETFEAIGIRVLNGDAAFMDRHHIKVNGLTISSDKFIIAAGTRPLVPPIKGVEDVPYLTNETLYDLQELPKSLAILGGGVDGLEYASAFGRLGVETTVIELSDVILPMVDRELSLCLHRALVKDGITLKLGARAVEAAMHDGRLVLTYEDKSGQRGEVAVERLLVALGRKPDLAGLGLENAGVNVTPRGIVTNAALQTSAPHIYACGDVVGPDQLASMAEYQGIIAATNAALPIKQKVQYRNSVYVIFTIPPLAFLGLTEAQAHAKYGHKMKVYRFEYSNMRRALIDGENTGLGKFICDGRGRLVGAHILGEAAPEVIHEAQIIKAMGRPLRKIYGVTHAYPTYAQALVGRASQLAFLDYMKDNPLVRAALKIAPGLSNGLEMARDRLAETHQRHWPNQTAEIKVSVQAGAAPRKTTSIKAVYRGSDGCVITLPSAIMGIDHRFLEAACAWQGRQNPQYVALDCSEVSRMNGLAAAMLVKFCARCSQRGQEVIAFGLHKDLRDVFAVSEIDQVIRVYDNEDEAFSAMQSLSHTRAFHEARKEPQPLVNAACWAKPVDALSVPEMPLEARNLNVNGLRAVGPVNGFGPLWQKTFQLFIQDSSVAPEEAIARLKKNFPRYQPSFNHFYPSEKGIEAGEIVLIDSTTPGGPVSTGVMVMYSDERSFTFNTPQGHPECGFVSFSASEMDDGVLVLIIGLARASDPLYEAAFRIAGSKIQTRIWKHVLTSLALDLGFPPEITMTQECIDTRLRWSEFGNTYYNAQLRTLINEPKRWFRSRKKG
ncbi:MAG: FAD-dependent oxidoreductase [Desulfomonilaceae bacterium]